MVCPACGQSVEAGQRFCASCGAPLVPGSGRADLTMAASVGETRLSPAPARSPTPAQGEPHSTATSGSGWLSTSDSIAHGRFTPGTVVAARYRIVGLLGRGGMGEVYRADDLRLGQPVALKFLPAGLAADAVRLSQFHNEVRSARHVAHPNVCRVYDIGDLDGSLYLTMEYVDGEDLGASLRRVGRFSEDRAVELARQICAGLAAAHERGIIHRDLKPANIMIDGQGRIRIMDFGLAAAGSVTGELAGTPIYMAPEQLGGGTVTPASDIYALGLVLYELFTGRPAFVAGTLADLVLQKASGSVTAPSQVVPALDPAIERAILRCLAGDPAARPSSALAVSALLPGGDPIATALAAGQLPSPEMIAAYGGEGAALGRGAGAAWAASLVALVLLVGWMADRATVAGQTDVRKPAAVLAEYARQIRVSAGYAKAPAHEAWGFGYNAQDLAWYAAHGGPADRWRGLADASVAPFRFWYRASDDGLDPPDPTNRPGPDDPPARRAGDTLVVLDRDAHLLAFSVVPSTTVSSQTAATPVDWAPLFRAAALDPAAFTPGPPARWPSRYADTVVAFHGALPRWPDAPARVDAAAMGGRPTLFAVAGPWDLAAFPAQPGAWLLSWLGLATAVIEVGLILFAVTLAVANVRAARVDRTSALRLAVGAFGVYMVSWLLLPAHSGDPQREAYRFFLNAGFGLFYGAIFGAAYLGFEPYVRRYSPHALVGWTRLVGGRVRDAVVGRDVLVGIVSGLVIGVVMYAYQVLPQVAGRPSPPGWLLIPTEPADGLASGLSYWCLNINLSLICAFAGMFVVAVLRRRIAAHGVVVALASVVMALLSDYAVGVSYDQPARLLVLSLLIALPLVVVLVRWGLLAGAAASVAWYMVTNMLFTLDPSRPYFAFSAVSAGLLVVAGLAGWRFARVGSGHKT